MLSSELRVGDVFMYKCDHDDSYTSLFIVIRKGTTKSKHHFLAYSLVSMTVDEHWCLDEYGRSYEAVLIHRPVKQ